MLRLNLLGTVDLVAPDGAYRNGDVGGTKPLALLVYLVTEGAQRTVRRDTAAALLWPESEQKNARQSLSQSLHLLRTALGDVIVSRGQEELALNRDLIDCDCFHFQELAANGRLEEAISLCRGEFAAGLYVRESPEYDHWVSRQRTFWRSNQAAVLGKLFDAALAAGDLGAAARWSEKLLDIAPEHDAPIRTLLRVLVERGQHGAALQLFERYQQKLHDAFELEPPAEIAALMAGLPQKQRPVDTTSQRSPLRIAAPLAARRRRRATALFAAVGLLGAGLLSAWVLNLGPTRATGSSIAGELSPPKVAVLPFGHTASARSSANVLNEALQWRLHDVGFTVLDAETRDSSAVRKLFGSGQPGMTFIIGGDIETAADASVVARLWLGEAGSGRRIWEARFEQDADRAHLVATQLSDAVVAQIRRAAGSAAELAAGAERVPVDIWKDVYRARERMEAAMDMRLHGATAGSLTELEDAELTLSQITAREQRWLLPWILRARIAEARATTALIGGRPAQGATELERGIRLLDSVPANLRSAELHEMQGLLHYRRWLFGVEEVDEASRLLTRAEADLRAAIKLRPDRSESYSVLSGVMFAQGKYAEAFVYARRAYDSNVFLHNNQEILNRLFNSAFHAGDYAGADRWCKELQRTQPGEWPAVLCRIHLAGYAPDLVDVNTLEREITHVAGPPPLRTAMQPRLKAAYAITLAQLGQADSARAILAAVADDAAPEVTLFSAFALAVLKDAPQAHAHLRSYLAENRGTRSAALHMRWLH